MAPACTKDSCQQGATIRPPGRTQYGRASCAHVHVATAQQRGCFAGRHNPVQCQQICKAPQVTVKVQVPYEVFRATVSGLALL